ncbi:MAG: hypothetical protein IPH46_07500 [Bacteroidetes bacterium]|nr:hypothetical protein [Bacteroidota bacterium]
MINYFNEIQNLKINHPRGNTSVHKPLLLLLTISEVIKGRSNNFLYDDIESRLEGLIERYSLTTTNTIKPQYPFLYLAGNPNIWLCSVDKNCLKHPDSASRRDLDGAIGSFPAAFHQFLLNDNGIEIINFILKSYWPYEKHQLILADLGIAENINDQIEGLSVRAKNIVSSLGGIAETIEYFKKHRNFMLLPKSGNKTDFELTTLCEMLLENEFAIVDTPPAVVEGKFPINILDCIDCYIIRRGLSTKRVQNYLDKIESESNFEKGIENKTSFILKYFINDFQFINVVNIGEKTVSDLEEIAKEIRAVVKYSNDSVTSDVSEVDIASEIYRRLLYKIPKDYIEKSIHQSNEFYNFTTVLMLFILQQDLSDRIEKTLQMYYFSDHSCDFDYLAQKLVCGKERIRQIIIKLESVILPGAISSLVRALDGIPSNVDIHPRDHIMDLTTTISDGDADTTLVPNRKFLNYTYSYLLQDEYLHINLAVFVSGSELKSFQKTDDFIFISKKFINETNFFQFIKWIDEEIYNFETCEFSYDLNVLIGRFFRENNCVVTENFGKVLGTVIDLMIRKDWSDIQTAVARNKRNQRKNEIFDLVHNFILDKQAPQKTNEIVHHLHNNHIDISKTEMLTLLNREVRNVHRVGNGFWTIEEYSNGVHGSIREIVADKLKDANEPLHISQLLDFMNSLRPTEESSLLHNLKSDEDKRFVFFNCSFIGLTGRKYSDCWKQLKRFNGNLLGKSYLKANNLNTLDEITRYYHEKLGYPPIHIKYILEQSGRFK